MKDNNSYLNNIEEYLSTSIIPQELLLLPMRRQKGNSDDQANKVNKVNKVNLKKIRMNFSSAESGQIAVSLRDL